MDQKLLDEKERRMARNLKKRYRRKSDLEVGLLALLCAERLIKRFYRRNKDCAVLVTICANIIDNLNDFKKDLIGYTEIVKKNTET